MSFIPAIHIQLESFTAFFRHPLTISGTQVTMPTPSYSTLLGLISACAGKVISPKDTQIGFEFWSRSNDNENERTERLVYEKGKLKSHREGSGILNRKIHFKTRLELYLTNLDLKDAFENPVNAPCIGRSQDLAWITLVKDVKLYPQKSGNLGPALIPGFVENVPGMLLRCVDWYENTTFGFTRLAGKVGRYHSMLSTSETRFDVTAKNLYHPDDAKDNDVIYLHDWTN